MSAEYQLVSLGGAPADLVAQVQRLYVASFPDEDRVPFESMLSSLRGEKDDFERVFWALTCDQRVLGMAYFLYDVRENLAYLEYIAIDPTARGQGLGQWLMLKILDKLDEQGQANGHPGVDWVVWEVQAPRHLADKAQRQVAERRIAFYKKFGARTFPVSFRYPPIGPGMPEVEYLLMARSSPPGKRMTRQRIVRIMDFCLLKINHFPSDGAHYQDAVARLSRWYEAR